MFKDVTEGGNGLFADMRSDKAKPIDAVAAEVMTFVKAHCPSAQKNSMAGFSVHGDREILKKEIKELYMYLSHQILDVSSILQCGSKWAPLKLIGKPENTSGHRAMSDVVHSIETLKFLRANYFSTA